MVVANGRSKPEPERVTMNGGMSVLQSMATLIFIAVMTFLPLKVVGAESAYDCGTIPCDALKRIRQTSLLCSAVRRSTPATAWVATRCSIPDTTASLAISVSRKICTKPTRL